MVEYFCMLAQNYKGKIEYPCWLEPKLDGMRILTKCTNGKMSVTSRANKPLVHLQRFVDTFTDCLEIDKHTNFMVDSEVHYKDWNTTINLAKKENIDEKDRSKLTFYAFDLISGRGDTTPFMERRKALKSIVEVPNFQLIEGRKCHSKKELMEVFQEFLDMGHEGVMIKSLNGLYEFKRSKAWLKLKLEETIDGVITEVIEGRNRHVGRLGAFKVILPNGQYTNVGGGFSDEKRDEYWKIRKELVGCKIEFKVQKEPNHKVAVARFPVFVRLRNED